MRQSQSFDVIVVGAGPAGCVVASRLSEDPRRRVALIEAGPDHGSDLGGWPAELLDPFGIPTDPNDWGHLDAGDRGGSPPLGLPRGRMVGGTSAINGCIWLRGSALDYDGWAALGNPGWGFADLLPAMRRAESDPVGGSFHGSDGPVPVSRVPASAWTEVDRRFVAAAGDLGLPFVADLSGTPGQAPAVGPTPRNVATGHRMNAALTYLARVRDRPNLSVLPDTVVDRVSVEGGRCVGVRTADGRQIPSGTVVLAGGAYGSPAVLLRSGIGPGDALRALGIPVVADLPGVGEHLLDHPAVGGLMECAVDPAAAPPTTTFMPIMARARSRQVAEEIDLHVYQGQSHHADLGGWTMWLSVSLEYARSRGRLRLTAADPAASLAIDHRHLSDPLDLEALCDGVEMVNALISAPPLAEVVTPIAERTLRYRDRDELRTRVLAQVGTTFHPTSTCRMGPEDDNGAVVDADGRVRGVDALLIADASIFPTGPRGNVHWPTVAIAETIAACLIGRR